MVAVVLTIAEGRSVILTGDYNLVYFTKRDKNKLQTIISPCDLIQSNIVNAARIGNSKVAGKLLKIFDLAIITGLKSVML